MPRIRPFHSAHSHSLPNGMGLESITRIIWVPSLRVGRSVAAANIAKVSANTPTGRRSLASESVEAAQALDAAELREYQRHQVIPALERLVVGVAVVLLHDRLQPLLVEQLEKASKDANVRGHARPLSVSRQPESSRFTPVRSGMP